MSTHRIEIEVWYSNGSWTWELYLRETDLPYRTGRARTRWVARRKAQNALMAWYNEETYRRKMEKKSLSYEAEIELED